MARVIAIAVLVAGATALIWVAARGAGQTDESTASVAGSAAAASAIAPPTPVAASATDQVGPDSGGDAATATDQVGLADDAASGAEPAGPAATPAPASPAAAPTPSIPEPENYGPRPDLVDIHGWLQTDATTIDDFDGQVLLVEMWTFGCHNCKARIPHNQSYYEEFGDRNFEILGVHAPEFSYEAEVANIVEALDRLGVNWPQALDTDLLNFRSWQPGSTNYWPRSYLIDQNGDIRYDHIGEGRYDELRETIRYLLDNPPEPRS